MKEKYLNFTITKFQYQILNTKKKKLKVYKESENI